MLSTSEANRVVHGIFREEVLILGALLSVHPVPRAFIDQLLQSLERVHQRAHRRLRAAERDAAPLPGLDRDPEIQRFLERLGDLPTEATPGEPYSHGGQG